MSAVVTRIVEAITVVPAAAVLGQTSDWDHNRSVITSPGRPDAVAKRRSAASSAQSNWIDLSRHGGVHPRIGAADVSR